MLLRRLLLAMAAILLVTSLAVPTQGQDKAKDDAKKPEEKKPEEKKPDEKKPDEKKPEEKKPEEVKKDDKKANLVWKFDTEKKTPFFQKMSMHTDQKFAVQGNVVSQTQDQTFYFSWTPEKKDGENYVLKQKVEGVKMVIDIGNGKIAYDSTAKNNDPNTLSEFFKALVGSEFTVTLDKNYTVVKIEGYKELVDKLVKANQAMKSLLDAILTEDSLKQMIQPTFAVLPGKEVKEGEEWSPKESTLNMGPIGSFTNTWKYKYAGKDPASKLDKIELTMNMTYKTPDPNAAGALPFKIKSGELSGKDAKGTVFYNPEKGYVQSSDLTLKLDGTLSIEIGGMTTEVKIDQTQVSKIETSDTKPAELTPTTGGK